MPDRTSKFPAKRKLGSITPVPTLFLDGLGISIQSIINDLKDMKPVLASTHDEVIRLLERDKVVRERISSLEIKTNQLEKPHDCFQESHMDDVNDGIKDLTVRQATLSSSIEIMTTSVSQIKEARKQFNYWLLGAIITVFSAVVGWIVTLTTLQAEVANIKEQQQTISDGIQAERGRFRTEAQQEAIEEAARLQELEKNMSVFIPKAL